MDILDFTDIYDIILTNIDILVQFIIYLYDYQLKFVNNENANKVLLP